MATTNSVTSSNTSTTTLSPFDITTNSTISFYNHQQNNCLNIPPVSTFIIPPTLPTQETSSLQNSSLLLPNIFINNSTTQQQQQQLLNVSETLPGLLASFLLNSGQNQSSPLCNLSASSLLSQQQQLIELLKQQSLQSSPSISQFQTIDFSSGQQRTPNGREAFEATALTNYQQLCRNSVIKPQLPPSAPQINSVNTLNIPPNFSNSPSLEQQLLLLLNLQQKPQNTVQNRSEPTVINCLERAENNLTSTHQIQQSTQQNSLDSFKDKEYKNCSIRRSSSSVSYYKTCSNSNADVSEHFKRTFSGKWPKKLPSTSLRSSYIGRVGGSTKTNKEGIAIEEGREIGFNNYLTEQGEKREESFLSIRMEKRPSSAFKNEEILQKIQSGTNCHLRQKVGYTLIRRVNLTSEDKQVEEHFRKSLGDDKFKQIRSSQRPNKEEEEENGRMDDEDIEI